MLATRFAMTTIDAQPDSLLADGFSPLDIAMRPERPWSTAPVMEDDEDFEDDDDLSWDDDEDFEDDDELAEEDEFEEFEDDDDDDGTYDDDDDEEDDDL